MSKLNIVFNAFKLLVLTPLPIVSLLLVCGACLAHELVDLSTVAPNIKIDLKYATQDNFMNERLYTDDRCFLRPKTARRLKKVQSILEIDLLGLIVYDCYRPLSVQQKMFKRFPQPGFVANPKTGSNHNRGAAVDVALVDVEGNALPMPSQYDEFSKRSHHNYMKATPVEIRNRNTLKKVMTSQGFKTISMEWWHYNDMDARKYNLLDVLISEL